MCGIDLKRGRLWSAQDNVEMIDAIVCYTNLDSRGLITKLFYTMLCRVNGNMTLKPGAKSTDAHFVAICSIG